MPSYFLTSLYKEAGHGASKKNENEILRRTERAMVISMCGQKVVNKDYLSRAIKIFDYISTSI